MRLEGWGRYPIIDTELQAPATIAAMQSALHASGSSPLVARGNGRSYGDSSLAPRVLSTRYLDCLLAFDEGNGEVRCGAGVLLSELLQVFVPRGWFLPVTPGTKYVSVGGAIASDVHGKNHHFDGCFSEFVSRFSLMLADGSIISCSREDHPDCFRATCGGMGLTGIILDATLQLRAVRSSYVEQTTSKARNLYEALACLDASKSATYSVAWIDCLARRSQMGRSLVMSGEHARAGGFDPSSAPRLAIPVDMPAQLLNPFALQAFNALYFHRARAGVAKRTLHYDPYFYPLDKIRHWNRLYGKKGFTQYQFVVPKDSAVHGLTEILQRITASRLGSFLAVLKLFGPQNDNHLSFPLEGYTLALDFKIEERLFAVLDDLDAVVLDFGGRLYLAKDARMSAATFRRSYSRWESFQTTRAKYLALGKFASDQSRRIGLD